MSDNNQITVKSVIEVLERYKRVGDIVDGYEDDWIKVVRIRDEETYHEAYLDELIGMLNKMV